MAVGSSVQLNEGTGIRVAASATYTENALTVRDEKVILGEPYLATYVVSTAVTLATGHLLQIMADSSNKIRVRRVTVSQYAVAPAAGTTLFELVRLTTAGTGGSALTARPLDTTEVAFGGDVRSAVGTPGTVGANLGFRGMAIRTAEPAGDWIEWDFDRPRSKSIIIAAGTANGLLFRANSGYTGGGALSIEVLFETSPF